METLIAHGIETFESCQGGSGHSFPEPTVRFEGGLAEGLAPSRWRKHLACQSSVYGGCGEWKMACYTDCGGR